MDIRIKKQFTPNPKAMKFVVNHDIISDGKVTYSDATECKHVPLAATLPK